MTLKEFIKNSFSISLVTTIFTAIYMETISLIEYFVQKYQLRDIILLFFMLLCILGSNIILNKIISKQFLKRKDLKIRQNISLLTFIEIISAIIVYHIFNNTHIFYTTNNIRIFGFIFAIILFIWSLLAVLRNLIPRKILKKGSLLLLFFSIIIGGITIIYINRFEFGNSILSNKINTLINVGESNISPRRNQFGISSIPDSYNWYFTKTNEDNQTKVYGTFFNIFNYPIITHLAINTGDSRTILQGPQDNTWLNYIIEKENIIEPEIGNPPEMKIEEHFVSKDQYGAMGYDKDMTGYYYYLTYPKIGISLSFEDDFASFFFTKTNLDQIYKYEDGEINIYSGTEYIRPFIKMYYKDPKISLKEAINLNHKELKNNNCLLLEEEKGIWENKHFPGEDTEIIYIDMSTNNMCSLFSDYEGMSIGFIMSKKYSDRYYMFYYSQGCAPTCEMPILKITNTNKTNVEQDAIDYYGKIVKLDDFPEKKLLTIFDVQKINKAKNMSNMIGKNPENALVYLIFDNNEILYTAKRYNTEAEKSNWNKEIGNIFYYTDLDTFHSITLLPEATVEYIDCLPNAKGELVYMFDPYVKFFTKNSEK